MATRADDFTEAANTALTAHTPTGANAGTGWTQEEATGTSTERVLATSDIVQSTANEADDRHLYTLQPDPAVVDYDVQATMKALGGTATSPWFFLARLTDASNYYSAGSYIGSAAADKKIFKKVATVVTELASGDSGLAANDVLKFEVRDAAKKLYKNGVEELSTTDNALTSAGRAGFGLGNAWVSTDDINAGWDADDFSYVEQAAAPTGHPAMRRLGLTFGMRPVEIGREGVLVV